MSRRWTVSIFAFTLLLASAGPVSAEQAAEENKSKRTKPPDRTEIERLVRRLGSDSYADRQEAMKELHRLGRPALEALRNAAANSDDKEIRRRAGELVGRLLEPPYEKRYKEGVRLLDQKNYRKAATELKQAAEMYENDPTIPRATQGRNDQPMLAEIYLHLARACRGCEDHEGAAGAYARAVYNSDHNASNRVRIEEEWRAMIDGLLNLWEKDIKAKIDEDTGLKALVGKHPLVILHTRRYAGGGYFQAAYSFIYETSDESKHFNNVHILFDNGPGDNTFNINMTTDQRNLVVDLGEIDFTKDPDPKKVDPDSDNFWRSARC